MYHMLAENTKKNNPSSGLGNKSYHSIGSHKERKYDTIPFRLEFIRELLDGKKLSPMVDLDAESTEVFINPNGYSQDGSHDDQSHDTRYVLNKRVHNFYKVINEIGGRLLYVKSGTTGHTFKGIVTPEAGININYAVKVCAYPKREKYGDVNDVRRPENAELKMIRLLSYFVIKKQSPHIVLPIGAFNTSIEPFVNLIETGVVDKSNKKYLEFVDRYKKGEYPDQVSVLISEWANKGDLLDFIRKNYREFKAKHWKVFFFQLISTLAVIQSKFPGFRHNDLKANNILVQKVGITRSTYTVNGFKYDVPGIGYRIKLWDFDFACIPGIVENAKVSADWTDEINVKPVQNRYYDMHYFFNTLIKKGFFPQFMEESDIPQEAKDFVNRVVPPKYQSGKYITSRGRILTDVEYLLPADVLRNDPYFEEFRNVESTPKKKKSSVDKEYIDRLFPDSKQSKSKKRYFLNSTDSN